VGLRNQGARELALRRWKIRSSNRISLAVSIQGTKPEIHDEDLPSVSKARYGRCLRRRSGSMGANTQRQTLPVRGAWHDAVATV